jgi:DNA-binding response OmpR family regulator
MSRLLIVEDEAHIASGLRYNLEADGHDVVLTDNGEAALEALAAKPSAIDLVVLDVMLPGMDGFTVASRMRAHGWLTPILMLTARGRAEDVLRGFEAGADDYLPKPFELSILLARVNALLRRHAWHAVAREASAAAAGPDVFSFADKTVDFDAQELRVRGKKYPLTLMEANLLRYLIQHEGKAVSRKNMLEDVWNLREDTDTRAIDHFIARLRKHIEKEPSRPRHLLTVRGVGYKFVANIPSQEIKRS